MRASQRQLAVLGAAVAVLVAILWWQSRAGAPAGNLAGAAPGRQATGDAPGPRGATAVPQVALDRLEAAPPEPNDTGRDPFHFGERARVPGRAGEDGEARAGADGQTPPRRERTVPAGPPPPPPIPLKFIGLVQRQGETGRIAVLSDGRGVYHGREGDVIDGRYRILRIGDEVIEMAHLDGRGRQMIRLSGA